MNLENQLLEKFQVEELEKRYEFSWVDSVEIAPTTIKAPDVEDPFGAPSDTYYGGSVKINF